MSEKKRTFEESMARLEEIVSSLEHGEVSLEESLALYEEGAKLMRSLNTQLDRAEQKVTKLIGQESGELAEVPFEETQE